MLLYAITDRRLLPGSEPERRAELISRAREWACGGVDYVQIREKDLSGLELLALARGVVAAVREQGSDTRVLVNGPAEIALESGADGVHLPGSAAAADGAYAREVYRSAGREAVVSHACHSVEEVRSAVWDASLIVFAPVFEKPAPQDVREGVGLGVLSEACVAAGSVPVVALGGVTAANAAECVRAGAAGVAGIRLFLGGDWGGLR
ncbi:MAG TPA: thiamine phosphate synthase [Silvibacterium sp.]|jgi:thiamine-phosphate pyrophosphorylase|nr:thiamine phosphate synthase [Silvibacterium sp.]